MKSFTYFKQIYIGAFVLVCVISLGVIGYIRIENYTLLEAFYMTIITFSSVGFSEVRQLSDHGRFFTSIFIIISMCSYVYIFSIITDYIVTGVFSNYIKNFKVNNKISKLENHVIVCGYGRNGKEACANLEKHGIGYVIIESNLQLITKLRDDQKVLFVEGDSTDEKALMNAGIN